MRSDDLASRRLPPGRIIILPRVAALLLLLAVLAGGCSTPMVSRTVLQEVEADSESDLSFWHRLAEAPLASNDDAFHALLLFFDGRDEHASYQQRRAAMQERGWISGDFRDSGEQAVLRGTVAVALAKALDVRGGLMFRLTSGHPRYATRELVHLAILPPSSPEQALSGSEMVGIIGRVEDYLRSRDALAGEYRP